MFGKGRENKRAELSLSTQKYIGICPMFIEYVNPSVEDYADIWERRLDQGAVQYMGTAQDPDGGGDVRTMTVRFICAPDTSVVPDIKTKHFTLNFILENRLVRNNDKTKIKVIDKFGRTAWLFIDDVQKHIVPLRNGFPIRLDAVYRPATAGEDRLTEFIKAFMNIPDIDIWDRERRIFVPDPRMKEEDCECRIDSLTKIINNGDVSEIRDAVLSRKDNKVKVCLGVRHMPDGTVRQTIFKQCFVRGDSTNHMVFKKAIDNYETYMRSNGRPLTDEYSTEHAHVYSAEASQASEELVIYPKQAEAQADNMSGHESAQQELPF